jgi:ribose transport system substrate-binding protein
MKRITVRALSLFITASGVLLAALSGAEAKTLGIVALIANDALNVAVIAGATDAAKAAGWDVKVTDTQASADQANAAMSSFAVQKVDAMMVLAFASSSIGAGLAAANAAGIPVASWGGEIVPGIVVTVTGRTVGDESAKFLLDKVGDNADILAMTFHPGKLCIDRGDAFDDAVKGKSGLSITYNEVKVPGEVQDGNAIAQPWLTAHPPGGKKPLAIWACWDEPMQGAVAALRQAGRNDVTTVAINGSIQALELVKAGDMTATVWQPSYAEGKAMFQAILDSIAAGKSWKPKTVAIPGIVVTKDNVDKFLADHPNGI